MKKVKVVIGANFGDEGKGLMTDYFCSRFPKEESVLNVRFNGGSQAAHTVVTPLGQRHIFNHYGSGSFSSNVATYLGPEFIVNPILFKREYEELAEYGVFPMVYVHPKCLLTIPQDMMLNQMLERKRGAGRHGSVGIGIFETLIRCKKWRITEANDPLAWIHSVELDYAKDRMSKLIGYSLEAKDKELLTNQNIMAHFAQDVAFFKNHVVIMDESIFSKFDNVVFEGAQGLLLDQNNLDYFPHLTPSNTGTENIRKYLRPDMDVEVCYVTRTYFTRHGAGKFTTECTREMVHAGLDMTNHKNEFQGSFRYGYFDRSAFTKAVHNDSSKLPDFSRISIAVTHADETNSRLMEGSGKTGSLGSIGAKYVSFGPARQHIQEITEPMAQ